MKIGFTIGKFAPFHKGHEYLIKTALEEMDKFYVVVYDTPQFDINIKTKINWIKNRFPEVEILEAYNSPKQYGLDKESVNIQMKYLSNIIKGIDVTHFYSSEEYGKHVAKYLNIENVLIDKERNNYSISASLIRNNVEEYKNFVDEKVYMNFREKRG